MSRDYLGELARLAATLGLDALTPEALDAARLVVLDTLGAILGGSTLPENRALAGRLAARASRPAATLIGHRARTDPLLATLANATAGVALEMDEGNRWGGGHPAIHVIPGALAVAEELGADGRRLIEAVVAGYEVCSRIGSATTPRPNVHSHGTWGTIGTAVAVARLLGHDAAAMRAIINLAASMSPANSWTPALQGATVRNLYPGRSGMQGILAVEAWQCGFTGLADGPADVYGTILADAFDPSRALEGLGGPLRIQQNYFKLHACCLYNHPALDAVLALREAERFTADEVRGVEVVTVPFGVRMADPAPPTLLAAKFSIPYAVAAALVRGRADVAAFEDGARRDPRIAALARMVEVRADPAMSMRRRGHPTATVTVRLADGRTVSRSTTVVEGDAERPVPAGRLVDKFLALATRALPEAAARRALARVQELERLKDVRELTALLGAPR